MRSLNDGPDIVDFPTPPLADETAITLSTFAILRFSGSPFCRRGNWGIEPARGRPYAALWLASARILRDGGKCCTKGFSCCRHLALEKRRLCITSERVMTALQMKVIYYRHDEIASCLKLSPRRSRARTRFRRPSNFWLSGTKKDPAEAEKFRDSISSSSNKSQTQHAAIVLLRCVYSQRWAKRLLERALWLSRSRI